MSLPETTGTRLNRPRHMGVEAQGTYVGLRTCPTLLGLRLTDTSHTVNSGLVSTSHLVLGLLARGERHGYDLKREHDLRFPSARPLAYGQIYATLERMQRQGLVDAVSRERVDGPDRTTFRMTRQGRKELTTWLAEVETPAPFVTNLFATKVTLALLTGDEGAAADYLRRQRQAHLARMRDYTRVKTDPESSLSQVLAADYALSHLDADLRWMETALDRVTGLTEEMP